MSNFFDKSINKAPIQYLTIAADDTIKLEILRKWSGQKYKIQKAKWKCP